MLRIILKIWPALLPITLYLLWIFAFKKLYKKYFTKKNYIEGELTKNDGEKNFSLENKNFVLMLYLTLILIIFSLIFTAFMAKPTKYIVEEKKIIVE